MTAEPIAKVVAEIRSGNTRRVPPGQDIADSLDAKMQDYARSVACLAGPVVDMTEIYHSLTEHPRPVDVYADHPCISPPWASATFAYVNQHGNVIVLTSLAVDYRADDSPGSAEEWAGWTSTTNVVDWDRVRWVLDSFVWLGGQTGDGEHIHTCGPWALWRFAIYDDGEPADLHWMQLCDYPVSHWDMASISLLGAAKADGAVGVPLTSVRGHFACYGPEYGRGLLFGKHAGRFWIPQHARGERSIGEVEHDYRLVTEATR